MTSEALAQELESPTTDTEAEFSEIPHRKVLSFRVHGESFALPIELIKEIIEFGSVTEVPMAPRYVSGVLNLRGSVIPVIDLGARLGRGKSDVSKRTCIVVISVDEGESESTDLGFVVDAVNEVLDVPEADIEPAPSFGASIRPDFIDGMAKVRGKFVIVLDSSSIFSISELTRLIGEPVS